MSYFVQGCTWRLKEIWDQYESLNRRTWHGSILLVPWQLTKRYSLFFHRGLPLTSSQAHRVDFRAQQLWSTKTLICRSQNIVGTWYKANSLLEIWFANKKVAGHRNTENWESLRTKTELNQCWTDHSGGTAMGEIFVLLLTILPGLRFFCWPWPRCSWTNNIGAKQNSQKKMCAHH